jgi:hypothetical protein
MPTSLQVTLLLSALTLLSGCVSTPAVVDAKVVAPSGNNFDAGIVSQDSNGAVVRQGFIDEYNRNIKNGYGKPWGLSLDSGYTPSGSGLYLIDLEHYSHALVMHELASSNIKLRK